MLDLPRIARRASLIAIPFVLSMGVASPRIAHPPPLNGLAGTWDIPDHRLEDGSTYHIYLELSPDQGGLSGRISYPWGYLPITSAVVDGDRFQLLGAGGKLLAQGDHDAQLLHVVFLVGRHAGPARTGKWIAAEPLPARPTYPAVHAVAPTGDAPVPPMGWNSWNNFKETIDDRTVRGIADAMVSSGMRDAGYTYLNIDDTWQGPRDTGGNITSNRKFPDMKALSDYVHARGLKLGIYSSPGPLTCAGYPGSLGREEQDAKTFAAWGIDYLKYDWCSAAKIYHPEEMQAVYQKMGDALSHSGRSILFSLCQYGEQHVWTWGPSVGASLWRTTPDIDDSWARMSTIGFSQSSLAAFAAPGHWNDPDMLEVGNGHMSVDEYRTHFSLWCLLAAPLLAGNDIVHMSAATRSILLNREVIALDQDVAGKQATLLQSTDEQEVWSKPLADGSTGVGLFNRASAEATVTLPFSLLGGSSKLQARDLWKHENFTLSGPVYTVRIPAHGVVLLRIRPHT